jgi:hypothetical protein
MSARGLYRTKLPRAEQNMLVSSMVLHPRRGKFLSEETDGSEGVVTVSLSAEAYTAVADRTPDPSEADNLGGYPISLPRALLSRLLRLREPNDKNFSDVIVRLAKDPAGEGHDARLRMRA